MKKKKIKKSEKKKKEEPNPNSSPVCYANNKDLRREYIDNPPSQEK